MKCCYMDKECDRNCIAYDDVKSTWSNCNDSELIWNNCRRLTILYDINTNLSYIRQNVEALKLRRTV